MTTVNNLELHLAWFLKTRPFIPFVNNLEAYTGTRSDPPSSSATLPLRHSQSNHNSQEDAPITRTLPPNGRSIQPPPAGAPSVRDPQQSAPARGRTQDMARLRAAPSSVAKPKLLCYDARPDLHAKSSVSPTEPHPAGNISRAMQCTTPHSDTRSKLDTSALKKKLEQVDAIDLSGDGNKGTSFKSPAQIPESKGRKRKSEEFEIDSGKRRASPRAKAVKTSPSTREKMPVDFTSIDDILDPPPPYSTVEAHGSKPSVKASACTSLEDGLNGSNDEESDTKTKHKSRTIGQSPKPNRTPQSPKKQVKVLSESPSSTTRQCRTGLGQRADVVSTDREVVALDSPPISPSNRRGMPASGLTPTAEARSKKNLTSANHTLSLEQQLFASQLGLERSPQGRKGTSPSIASPKLQRSPTAQRSLMNISAALETSPVRSSQSGSRLDEPQKQAVQTFMKWAEPCIDARLTELKTQLRQTKGAWYDALNDGGPVTRLEAEVKTLQKQQSAVDKLKKLRETLHSKRCRREELKKIFMARFDEAIQGKLELPLQEENKAVSKALNELEEGIYSCLHEAGFLDKAGLLIDPGRGRANQVLVKSTQATPASESRDSDDAEMDPSEFVEQTQIPPALLQGTPTKRAKSKRRDLPWPSTETVSPRRQPQSWDPPVESHGAPTNQGYDMSMGDEDDALPTIVFDDEDGDMDEEPMFSTRMGTPPPPMEDDEFDCFDDEDMLEAAENAETRTFTGNFDAGIGSRNAFGEISGNRQPRVRQAEPTSVSKNRRQGQTALSLPAMQHRWSEDVRVVLRDRFRLKGFRPNQLEAINETLAGRHVFVLMPTGGGKSLCYQLPSLIQSGETRGVTIVVSPLVSLMEDQVSHLKKLRIQAFVYNGDVALETKDEIRKALRGNRPHEFIQVLYITPEMLTASEAMVDILKSLHERRLLARVVIDEAHCVSQWGHDFRPDYKKMGGRLRDFKGVPIMALTATATSNVKEDTKLQLGIKGCAERTQSFNRPNLHYEILPKAAKSATIESIAKIIKNDHPGQCGIVYCFSRQSCEDVAKNLRENHKIRAWHYHAGMEPVDKSNVQKRWQSGQHQVIVATIAFGMGIDKPNVRFVIHETIPKSLEGYYQETGRAGRDGKISKCYLFHSSADFNKLAGMINKGEGDYQTKSRQREMLRNVTMFCENRTDCRRVQLLAYFSEQFNQEDCHGGCDNCISGQTYRKKDFTELAVAAVRIVEQLEMGKVTLLHCVDVLHGKTTGKVGKEKHTALSEHGLASNLDRSDVQRLFQRLVFVEALVIDNVKNRGGFMTAYICLGKKAMDFLRGRARLELDMRVSPGGQAKRPAASPKVKSTKKKRASRTGVAAAFNLPPSTNVSSPVQDASRRRVARFGKGKPPEPSSSGDGSLGNFVVDDSDSDSFQPAHRRGKPTKSNRRELGPPITSDRQMEELDPLHRDFIGQFVVEGEKICKQLVLAKGLRAQPFTTTMLREMFIKLPRDEKELCTITGIDPEQVKEHGKKILPLIERCETMYREITTTHGVSNGYNNDANEEQFDGDADGGEDEDDDEERILDPNHENVINLISDDDDDDEYGSEFDLDEADALAGQARISGTRSSYFRPTADVEAFNSRVTQQQSQPPSPAPAAGASYRGRSEDAGGRSRGGGGWRGGGSGGGRSNYRKGSGGGRSGGGGRGKASGVRKFTKKTGRSSGSGSKTTRGGSGGSKRSGGGGAGGIELMPI